MVIEDTSSNFSASSLDEWRGDNLYRNCLLAVCTSKKLIFPKGAATYKNQLLASISTPFGKIDLFVRKNDCCLGTLMSHVYYLGKLTNTAGASLGSCFFSLYRTARGHGYLSEEAIFLGMDSISEDASELFEVLDNDDGGFDVEQGFNVDGVLVADEINVDKSIRGSLAWKILYFSTLSAVFAHQRRTYREFVFIAHPLINSDVTENTSNEELRQQAQGLRRFYAVHLSAKVIRNNGTPTDYMSAPVPKALIDAWPAPKQKKSAPVQLGLQEWLDAWCSQDDAIAGTISANIKTMF